MRNSWKWRLCHPARFHSRPRSLSPWKQRYIDKGYTICILTTYRIPEYAKSRCHRTAQFHSLSRSLSLWSDLHWYFWYINGLFVLIFIFSFFHFKLLSNFYENYLRRPRFIIQPLSSACRLSSACQVSRQRVPTPCQPDNYHRRARRIRANERRGFYFLYAL